MRLPERTVKGRRAVRNTRYRSTTRGLRQSTFDPMRSPPQGAADVSTETPLRFPELDVAFDDLLVRVGSATEGLDSAGAQALLRALLGMQERFGQCVDTAARRAHDHLSWQAIGRIAGVTKQAAHHRWGRSEDPTEGFAG